MKHKLHKLGQQPACIADGITSDGNANEMEERYSVDCNQMATEAIVASVPNCVSVIRSDACLEFLASTWIDILRSDHETDGRRPGATLKSRPWMLKGGYGYVTSCRLSPRQWKPLMKKRTIGWICLIE